MTHHAEPTQLQAIQVIPLLCESLASIIKDLRDASAHRSEFVAKDLRDDHVKVLLLRSAEMGAGCVDLGRSANPTALIILARASLENCILLLWLIISEDHPRKLKEEGLVELKRLASINMKNGLLVARNRDTGANDTVEMLQSWGSQKLPKGLTVSQRACAAGVEDLYNTLYRAISMEMHGHSLDSGAGCPEITTVGHLQGVGALLKGTALVGVVWLRTRKRVDNEMLRVAFGLK